MPPVRITDVLRTAGANILVLAPHPDDFDAIAVTLRVLQTRGDALHLAVCTSGAGGVDDADCDPPTPETKAALREREQRESCRRFGLPGRRLRFLRLTEDATAHPVVGGRNTEVVAALLEELRPEAVFLPHGNDTSVGHQRTYALLRSCAPAGLVALLNRDPKTIAMREDVLTPYDAERAAWKASLLRLHVTQQRRNLRARGRGFDERILSMDADTAQRYSLAEPYAEAFEVERYPLAN